MIEFSPQSLFDAAVVRKKGGAFELEQIKLGALRSDEVVVRIVATGMCHTDMAVRDEIIPVDKPVVLGHEGAGIIESVGDGVETLEPGDHVVLSFLSCDHCQPCLTGHPAYCDNFNDYNFSGCRPGDCSHAVEGSDGAVLHDRFFGQSSFARFAVANKRNVVKVRKDVPLELLGPLGCGIQTGAGTVLNALDVEEGTSIAIFGSGAVGLSAVMAAVIAGATTIIIVDINPLRLEFGKSLGATHAINSQESDPVEKIREITGKGVAYAIDTTGIGSVIENAVAALAPNGTMALVGASKPDTILKLNASDIMIQNKRIRGVIEGDSIPGIFIPRLIDLYVNGRFPFDRLIKFYDFSEINQAAEDSEKGKTLKPVIMIGNKPSNG